MNLQKKKNFLPLIEFKVKDIIFSKVFIISHIILVAIVCILVKGLIDAADMYNFKINNWDIVFRVITFPFLIVYVYIPILIIITNKIQKRDRDIYSVAIRIKEKKKIIFVNTLVEIIIILMSIVMVYGVTVILSLISTSFSVNWSDAILGVGMNPTIAMQLYPSAFITQISPINAFIISFVQLFIGLMLIMAIRDFLCEYLKSFKTAIIITALILFINFGLTMIPIILNSSVTIQAFNLSSFVLIWMHNFGELTDYVLTIGQSIGLGIIIIIIINCVRFLNSRNMVVNNDL